MALKCTVSQHVSRDAIESSLIHGEPMQDVAGRYSISKSALHRHKNTHLPEALAKAQEAEEIVRGDSLLGEMEVLIEHGHEQQHRKDAYDIEACTEYHRRRPLVIC